MNARGVVKNDLKWVMIYSSDKSENWDDEKSKKDACIKENCFKS